LQSKFLLENIEKSELNVAGEAVVAANVPRRSIEGDVAQEVVLAGQEKLEESKKILIKKL
jgi:hypothetical protein